MNDIARIGFVTFVAVPAALLSIGGDTPRSDARAQVKCSKYLVTHGDCSACHTPPLFGPNQPEPDLKCFLSVHPGGAKLPPPSSPEQTGPRLTQTADLIALAGPWGVSYAANIAPDMRTGPGIWIEEVFAKMMKTGKRMESARDTLPPMPWQIVSQLCDNGLKTISAYLRPVPSIRNSVPDPLPDGKPTCE